MPTLDSFGKKIHLPSTPNEKDTIKLAMYADWKFTQVTVNEAGDEFEDKYPETLRTVGYIVKRPTTDRVRRLERLAGLAAVATQNPTKAWNKFCAYVVEDLIVDWYNYKMEGADPTDPDDPDENTPWEEAKKGHLKLFRENLDLPGRFLESYVSTYMGAEKKTEDDLDGL